MITAAAFTARRLAHVRPAAVRLARAPLAPLVSAPAVRAASTSAVPDGLVKEGEYLLYTAESGVSRSLLPSYLFACTSSVYVAATTAAEWLLPVSATGTQMDTLSPWLKAIISGITGAMWLAGIAEASATVKYAVVTRDGLHLRLYPFGRFFGKGTGAPVEVPIKLLYEVPPVPLKPGATMKDSPYVAIGVQGSKPFLRFYKPTALGALNYARISGSGMTFGRDGLVSLDVGDAASSLTASGSAASSPGASAVPPSWLSNLPAVDRDRVKAFALLAWVCAGHPVSPSRLAEGGWELDNLSSLSATAGKGGKERDAQELAYWRKAVDKAGRGYWFNALTWASQWDEPQVVVDGRAQGPYELHGDRGVVKG